MTNKKIKNKIAKVLRKYFNFTFVESQVIAKAMVDNFIDPSKILIADKDKLMVQLFYLAFFVGWNPKIMRILNRAIDYYSLIYKKAAPYQTLYCNCVATYKIHSYKTGHSITTDTEY